MIILEKQELPRDEISVTVDDRDVESDGTISSEEAFSDDVDNSDGQLTFQDISPTITDRSNDVSDFIASEEESFNEGISFYSNEDCSSVTDKLSHPSDLGTVICKL